MKKYIILFALMAVIATTGLADTTKVSIEKFEIAVKAYKDALNSDNIGVRNSALYQIAKLKKLTPEYKLSKFDKSLLSMTKKDDEGYLRVNAKLVYLMLNSFSLFLSL